MFYTLFDQVMQVMSTSDALFHRVLLAVMILNMAVYILYARSSIRFHVGCCKYGTVFADQKPDWKVLV